jgi:hypothetical protein
MSVLIREDVTKETVAVPVKLTAAFPIEAEALARTYKGTRIGDFIDLLPWATAQRIGIDCAKKWIQHMASQGYELIGNETDIKMWGPYRPKSELYKSFGGERSASSISSADEPFPDGKAKMLLTGHFLARKQHLVEHGN